MELSKYQMNLDIVLETLATITGVLSSFAMLPQIYRIFKRKSAKDISIWTYLYMFVAGVIWILYGLNIQSFAIWFSQLIGSLAMIGIIIGWFLYGR
jgi:MtN3 and saliva related transmembrane protein